MANSTWLICVLQWGWGLGIEESANVSRQIWPCSGEGSLTSAQKIAGAGVSVRQQLGCAGGKLHIADLRVAVGLRIRNRGSRQCQQTDSGHAQGREASHLRRKLPVQVFQCAGSSAALIANSTWLIRVLQ